MSDDRYVDYRYGAHGNGVCDGDATPVTGGGRRLIRPYQFVGQRLPTGGNIGPRDAATNAQRPTTGATHVLRVVSPRLTRTAMAGTATGGIGAAILHQALGFLWPSLVDELVVTPSLKKQLDVLGPPLSAAVARGVLDVAHARYGYGAAFAVITFTVQWQETSGQPDVDSLVIPIVPPEIVGDVEVQVSFMELNQCRESPGAHGLAVSTNGSMTRRARVTSSTAIDLEPTLFTVYETVLAELEWCAEQAGACATGELAAYRQELLATLADYFAVDVAAVTRHIEGML